MSVKKFKFVSPGVFVKEIDNSQIPAAQLPAGPVIFGRLPKGPAMEPVMVKSFSEFVEIFGNPVPGSSNGDVFREGNMQGPTYASYAAQAYLAAGVGSVNVMRLAGAKNVDATSAGFAGWSLPTPNTDLLENGGAYGLFVINSGSSQDIQQPGILAAIFYMATGSAITLSGTVAGDTNEANNSAQLIESVAAGPEFRACIYDKSDTIVHETQFNFDKDSSRFIRNVFNTNPQTTNTSVVDTSELSKGSQHYWLGESFSAALKKMIADEKISATPTTYATILPLDLKESQRQDFKNARTGWFFSQDLTTDWATFEPADMQKLFKIHSRNPGSSPAESLKVAIQDLRYSRSTTSGNKFGSFTLVLRSATDTDNVVEIVERYSNLNLNPNSENYIGRRIGTRYLEWDTSERRLKEYGDYANVSSKIRVEISPAVENGSIDSRLLPFGVFGPPKFNTVVASSGSVAAEVKTSGGLKSIIQSGSTGAKAAAKVAGATSFQCGTLPAYTASLAFPATQTRLSASDGGLINNKLAYFGVNASSYFSSDGSLLPDPGYGDYLYSLPLGAAEGSDKLGFQWTVTLDDLVQQGNKDSNKIYWKSGSRKLNESVTADSSSWQAIIDKGYTRFMSPLYDGFDGLDITEIEPFRNTKLSDGNVLTNYAVNSIRRAIDTVADPEVVECNSMTMPGLTNPALTEHIIQTCEDRGDALAIIDVQNAYTPPSEGGNAYDTPSARRGDVAQAVSSLETREINSSYGCAYYPWIQIRDTINGSVLWAPPSIVALGVFASAEASSDIWFAPAGFNRGGLSQGNAGLPVLGVSQKLTSSDRDDLYEANINPIASFPNEGIVIFGQKTLQATPSALDRINVRRMMIFVKKQISQMATSILFDQNTRVTWNRFKSLAEPFLSSVQTRLGISDYKLVLDSTTTTPDLVDQNIVYAKIFLKPTKAIEYIAVDFVITNTGAGFGD